MCIYIYIYIYLLSLYAYISCTAGESAEISQEPGCVMHNGEKGVALEAFRLLKPGGVFVARAQLSRGGPT